MTTALDIITDALQKTGIYAPSETINDADANIALIALNKLIDSWREEFLYLYELTQTVIQAQNGKQVYTIGAPTGADIVQPRPQKINGGPGAAMASLPVVALASAATAPLNFPILNFSTTAGVVIGHSVVDLTNPDALAKGTVVVDITPTTVTISPGAKGAGVQNADTIVFGTAPEPVDVISAVEWQTITTVGLASGRPDALYYAAAYPLGILALSPIPDAPWQVVFGAWLPFLGFSDLLLPDVTLAQGGENALRLNLAVILKNYFNDAVLAPEVIGGAANTREMLRYTNIASRAMLNRGKRQAAASAAPEAAQA